MISYISRQAHSLIYILHLQPIVCYFSHVRNFFLMLNYNSVLVFEPNHNVSSYIFQKKWCLTSMYNQNKRVLLVNSCLQWYIEPWNKFSC